MKRLIGAVFCTVVLVDFSILVTNFRDPLWERLLQSFGGFFGLYIPGAIAWKKWDNYKSKNF